VGNDAVLSIIHEARMQFFFRHSYTELDCGGVGLIMYDARIEFKKELFYGDTLNVSVQAANFTQTGFDLFYKLEKKENGKSIIVATAKTGMLCYNYDLKRIAFMPAALKEKLAV
jgi:acyl-CoA thioesterase FadM